MKRLAVFSIAASLVIGLFATFAPDADAQRRGRRAKNASAPMSEGIANALGEVQWGWSRNELYSHFEKDIKAKYREKMAKARDAMTQDNIRAQMTNELGRIRRSFTRFDGQTSGWDVSFLRDEFTHNNGESMLVVRDGNSQNFYFFINDKLWKWYKAFDSSVFDGADFDAFSRALTGRFGKGLSREGKLTERGDDKQWLEWQDQSTRLRAIDENRFYGFYCLVFEDKATLKNLDRLRTNRAERQGTHSVVDAVTADDDAAPSTANQDIVDRITGRIRRRDNADEDKSSMSRSMRRRGAAMRAARDEDPLSDIDL